MARNRNKDLTSSNQYRDVLSSQDEIRGQLGKKKSVGTRLIGSFILGLLVACCLWIGVAFVESFSEVMSSADSHSILNFGSYFTKNIPIPTMPKIIFSALGGGFAWLMLSILASRSKITQDATVTTDDINQYVGDQHIAHLDEIQARFDIFPDVGAHSSVSPSSMISHMALTNKGLNKIAVARRAETDIYDEDGDLIAHKGEILTDENGDYLYEMTPMIDKKHMEALFEASGVPVLKRPHWYSLRPPHQLRRYFDPKNVEYNRDRKNRDKKPYDTWADLINNDWEFPAYETQRPAGAYLVDTRPVNTMVIAITRAGKGQTCIEPTIDMWTREKEPNNMVINDPKGELLVKNYVKGAQRGFQIVQFNLINVLKTDIYNPLYMAADAAREGEFTKCASYVENIANVFFPTDGAEDPVWPNAANNCFKRAAYGMIDFFLEEENEIRLQAQQEGWSAKVLNVRLDELWGKVTLYNVYQFFVQMTSKMVKNPQAVFNAKASTGEMAELNEKDPDAYDILMDRALREGQFWENNAEMDMLSLYFNATKALPQNKIRELISNADNALRSMAGAEKMLASVYGIAITAMSFFTDPTIATMTSGTPSQNVDLEGISFPRRIGVRFRPEYIRELNLQGAQAVWQAYSDKQFKKPLDDPKTPKKKRKFYHEDLVTQEGWARFYFKGIFPKDTAYIRLQIRNSSTGMLIKTFYFEFKKSYQTSLDGRHYLKDPVLDEKIVRDGTLTELIRVKTKTGKYRFTAGNIRFNAVKLDNTQDPKPRKVYHKMPAIRSESVRYSEKCKMIFLITPPHLTKYAKLLLILLKQLVDLNFEKSYMTKPDQKPLYKTRFMLDELGNLQSEGHGIQNFETMLSIGLGQDQQFTLILQTLQQLRDVYGDSVDKIVQGNIANIIFLKSTDDTMIETLQKMSGTTHKAYRSSKTVQQDVGAIALKNKSDVTYTINVVEEPVIKYNDLAFLSDRNSIVFSTESPIWNRNETILPMSYKLYENTISMPGKDYTLQSIPTLSTASEFDRDANQPNFQKMYEKRLRQAARAADALTKYKEAYGYTDYDIARLDKDVFAEEVMAIINQMASQDKETYSLYESAGENEKLREEVKKSEAVMAEEDKMRYAGNRLSKSDLFFNGQPRRNYEMYLIEAYKKTKKYFAADRQNFRIRGNDLYGVNGRRYITCLSDAGDSKYLNKMSHEKDSPIYAEDQDLELDYSWKVEDDFFRFLTSVDAWTFAQGKFEEAMIKLITE